MHKRTNAHRAEARFCRGQGQFSDIDAEKATLLANPRNPILHVANSSSRCPAMPAQLTRYAFDASTIPKRNS